MWLRIFMNDEINECVEQFRAQMLMIIISVVNKKATEKADTSGNLVRT